MIRGALRDINDIKEESKLNVAREKKRKVIRNLSERLGYSLRWKID